MHERYYEIFETFKRYFPSEVANIVDWRPSVRNEIIVYLKDGDVMYFSGNDNRYGYIKKHSVDEFGDYDMSDEELRVEFSNKLKRLIQARYMNQRGLSEATGISVAVINHYITGRNLPDFKNLRRLSKALECSVSELVNID